YRATPPASSRFRAVLTPVPPSLPTRRPGPYSHQYPYPGNRPAMNSILREYLLKGVFLGLWAYLAALQLLTPPDWTRFGRVVAAVSIGLGLGLVVGAVVQLRRGLRPGANPLGFLLAVLMDSPLWIYLGVVGGLGLGVTLEYDPPPDRPYWLVIFA